MQFQRIQTGLSPITDISGLHPGQELIGKPVSAKVGQLRAGDLQIHLVAENVLLVLSQDFLMCP